MLRFLPCLLIFFCVSAYAEDLLNVYADALANDPSYQAAEAKWLSEKEKQPQALAGLLPELVADGSTTGQRVEDKINDVTSKVHSHSVGLTLTQPVFDFAAWQTLARAKLSVKQAAANFAAAKQTLMTRTASAYFAVLLADDLLNFTQAQEKATAQQLEQAQQRYDVGLVTMNSVYQARARHDQLVADVITKQNDLRNAREALRQITGKYYKDLVGLKADLTYVQPQPANIDDWVKVATDKNLDLVAARFAMQAAKANIKQQYAGHLPTVDVVGSIKHAEQGGAAGFPNQDTKRRDISLQGRLPLFQGGLINANVRQAKQQYYYARDIMREKFRAAEYNTRQSFNNLSAQISKIKAGRQSVISNKSSVKSTEDAYRLGTNTIIDVLQTQKDLFKAQADLADDQYKFINNLLALKQATGTLTKQDLAHVNQWLVG